MLSLAAHADHIDLVSAGVEDSRSGGFAGLVSILPARIREISLISIQSVRSFKFGSCGFIL